MRRHLVACVTCDVEIGSQQGLSELKDILRLLRHHSIRATFFLLLSSKNFRLFESCGLASHLDEHEFGLHVHWGGSGLGETPVYMRLDSIDVEALKSEMEEALEYCRKLGFRPTSFRAGGLSQTTRVLKLVHRYGFRVDSSVASGLNERTAWSQRHLRVPYRSWYFPDKSGYDIPASSDEDRIGILEIPVTRLIPSFGSWSPYTLTPTTPLSKIIVRQWIWKSRWENPLVITPLFHSWGRRCRQFGTFMGSLSKMMEYLRRRKLQPLTVSEAYDLVVQDLGK